MLLRDGWLVPYPSSRKSSNSHQLDECALECCIGVVIGSEPRVPDDRRVMIVDNAKTIPARSLANDIARPDAGHPARTTVKRGLVSSGSRVPNMSQSTSLWSGAKARPSRVSRAPVDLARHQNHLPDLSSAAAPERLLSAKCLTIASATKDGVEGDQGADTKRACSPPDRQAVPIALPHEGSH